MNVVGWLLCVACLTQADLSRPVEITEQRADYLSESLQELKFLTERLEALGDPSQRRPEEQDDSDAYYARVQQIYENRARILIVLHWEYEEALEARFTLEADLHEYAQQMETVFQENEQRIAILEGRREQLAERELRARNEGIVVAALILRQLQERERQLGGQADRAPSQERELERIRGEMSGYGWAEREAPRIAGRDDLERKYANHSLEELQTVLTTQRALVVDSQFEVNYLRTRVLQETPELLDEFFGTGSAQALARANDLLRESQVLEDRAAWVAILANYLYEDLEAIGRARSFVEQRQALRTILDQESVRRAALHKIAGQQLDFPAEDLERVFVRGSSAAGP